MPPLSPTSPKSSRKPLPQPIEETRTSNRVTSESQSPDAISKKSKRHLPQPIETSNAHSKKSNQFDTPHGDVTAVISSQPPRNMDPPPPKEQKPRRFTPQIIETSRRRRKSTDTVLCATPTDESEVSIGDQDHLPKHMRSAGSSPVPIPPENSPAVSSKDPPRAPESRFSSSKLAEKQERRHSFRVPDLPAIPSQSGTESNVSSLSNRSSSPSAESDETEQGERKTKKKKQENQARRESQDPQWSGYLLSLAAKTAEKQLREQAMAAYPNEHDHEPVDHYAIDRDSEEADVEVGVGKLQVDGPVGEKVADRSPAGYPRHRDSASGFDLAEMRKHQQTLEQQRKDQWDVDPSNLGRRRSTRQALQEAQNDRQVTEAIGAPQKEILGWQKDNEMKPMQKAASPPMAGGSLIFPKCQSPRATQLDVHQHPGSRKPGESKSRQHTGLWTPGGGSRRNSSMVGLWHGVCNAANQEAPAAPKNIQSGLLTPSLDRGDPFSSAKEFGQNQLPPSPPNSQEDPTSLDTILRREQNIDNEFNDVFVTQVYNYLSLGYPSLARKFDFELSKITNVSVEDLRKDDDKCNAKGYVGAPEGTGADVRGVMEGDEKCERWCALRLYVKEWGRQQPGMGGPEELEGGWGARARKGSWAI
ncbi:hypothetical protein ACLMJK_002597 [Lecanora helva]